MGDLMVTLTGKGATDMQRMIAATAEAEGEIFESKDWKVGEELRDDLTNKMNTYGLVMALLITLTFGQDTPEAHAHNVWNGDGNSIEIVTGWYFFFLYMATILFGMGLLSVVEILDRLSVLPVFLVKKFMLKMGPSYFNKPTFFLYPSVVCFFIALALGASIQLTLTQFVIFMAIFVLAVVVFAVHNQRGIKGNRSVVIEHLNRPQMQRDAAQESRAPGAV